ncbi:MAG: hypothetical protein WA985_11015 [Erythrobacter sp.]|uniref:hypothetical protein n=1 Tax=Erythrobacter sp. TaxID=1042 RepID=UPI003C7145E5
MGEKGMKHLGTGSLALIVAATLAACGSDASDADSEGAANTSTDYTIDSDTGEERMTISTPEGDIAMRSGTDVPIDLPDGFDIIADARITSNTVVDQADGKGAIVGFESDATPDEVMRYYREQAEAAGIDIEVDLTVNDGRVLGGRNGSGTTFSLNASPIEGGTRAQLVVGRGEDY